MRINRLRLRFRYAFAFLSLLGAWLCACAANVSPTDEVSAVGAEAGANQPVGHASSALTDTATGLLMVFGGNDGSICVEESGTTNGSSVTDATCSSTNTSQQFTMVQVSGNTSNIKTNSGLCLQGVASTGVVTVATCSSGDTSQEWIVEGGQIFCVDNDGDRNEYCLDILDGNESTGATVDLAVCNGTASQVFWTTGYTIGIGSTKIDPNNSKHECLDVDANNENPNATLDDSDCNQTNAQWFVMDLNHRLELANDTSLCVAKVLTDGGATADVELEDCSSSSVQEWYLGNESVNNGCTDMMCSEVLQSTLVNFSTPPSPGCLDIAGNSSTSGTTVDDHTCNSTSAQLWVPFLYYMSL
jgi:hypothetical protein